MKDYTPFQKQLGRFLATRRMQKHLTQQEMAEKLYLDRSAISKMERGDYKMLLFRIMDYCREIDVHLSEVIKEFESPPPR